MTVLIEFIHINYQQQAIVQGIILYLFVHCTCAIEVTEVHLFFYAHLNKEHQKVIWTCMTSD